MSTTSDFFREQSEKSAIKSAIVTNFFGAYIRIINARFDKTIYYIDLFAGPGRYENGTPSTPINILEVIDKFYELKSLKMQCVFNEQDKKLYSQLEKNITDYETSHNLPFSSIITNKNAADVNLRPYLNGRDPVFSFVDPWGYVGTSADCIWDLVRNIGSDCVFFFNANRILMDFYKKNKETDFIKLFGNQYAKLQKELKQENTHSKKMEKVLLSFSKNLKEIVEKESFEYHLYILPFGFSFDDREKDSHYLLFITKNHKAVMTMKDVMSKFATTISETYSFDSKVVNQLSLFNIEDDGYSNFIKFTKLFSKIINNKEWRVNEFCKALDELSMKSFYKVTPFTINNIKKYLRRGFDEGRVICDERFRPNEIFSEKRAFELRES